MFWNTLLLWNFVIFGAEPLLNVLKPTTKGRSLGGGTIYICMYTKTCLLRGFSQSKALQLFDQGQDAEGRVVAECDSAVKDVGMPLSLAFPHDKPAGEERPACGRHEGALHFRARGTITLGSCESMLRTIPSSRKRRCF